MNGTDNIILFHLQILWFSTVSLRNRQYRSIVTDVTTKLVIHMVTSFSFPQVIGINASMSFSVKREKAFEFEQEQCRRQNQTIVRCLYMTKGLRIRGSGGQNLDWVFFNFYLSLSSSLLHTFSCIHLTFVHLLLSISSLTILPWRRLECTFLDGNCSSEQKESDSPGVIGAWVHCCNAILSFPDSIKNHDHK